MFCIKFSRFFKFIFLKLSRHDFEMPVTFHENDSPTNNDLNTSFFQNLVRYDTLNVFAVHGIEGILGTIMVSFLALETFSGAG